MKETVIKSLFSLVLFSIIFLSACEEAALPLNIDETPLFVDTVSFPVIQTITYQVPPKLGANEYLYFGRKGDFKFLYNLLSFNIVDSTNLYSFKYYNDSLIVADSMKLIMNFTLDSIPDSPEFQLRYFPSQSDSVFNELETNIFNFDPNIASSIISNSSMSVDSVDSNTTKVKLSFLIDTTIINVFKDTSLITFNQTFLIELKNEFTSELKFFSSDNIANPPKLLVYYRQFLSDSVVLDSSFHTYYSTQDVSIMDKVMVSTEDTTNLSVGLAKGLRSLLMVDMGDWVLPPRAIISSAELTYNRVEADTLKAYSVLSYPIIIEGDYSSFNFFELDPYIIESNFQSSASINNNILKLNYRKISTEFGRGKIINYGFKIQSNPNNDPFQTVQFHSLSSPDLYPEMRVIYVYQ
mgnify:CR=1 FL=1